MFESTLKDFLPNFSSEYGCTYQNELNCLLLASKAHEHQTRKNLKEPYMNHCIRVGAMAKTMAIACGYSQQKAAYAYCVGLLHDTIEDQQIDFEDIVKASNEVVAMGVAFLTDDKRMPSVR